LCFSRLEAALLEVEMEGEPLEVEFLDGRCCIGAPPLDEDITEK
jgi:hypothetical protein